MEDQNPELEAFRRQWREEVSAKSQDASKVVAGPSRRTRRPPPITQLPSRRPNRPTEDDEDHVQPQIFSQPDASRKPGHDDEDTTITTKSPETALEHYEKAVEREREGSLGDSLNLYRKAFRMDQYVDVKYKQKHFPASSFKSKPSNPNPSNASATVPNPAHHSLDGPPQSIKQLIAGFSHLSIEAAPPAIEGTQPPSSPFAELPEEITIQILKEVAVLDVASFVKLAQVCKRMAYLVLTEEQIWKRVCLGTEVGFGAMHYGWQRDVLGGPLQEGHTLDDEECLEEIPSRSKEDTTDALFPFYSSSWQQMFRLRPRIRFNGCYISTVNYIRPGQGSQSQVTWHNPVHIVTYYRYLRFFRDGTVISLLTTDEPADVVHHLTKELQDVHRGGNSAHLSSIVMQNALRGRWRLSTTDDSPELDLKDAEGGLFIETEGVNEKYLYRMKLALRSAGKGAKNNKLVWEGFWNYNILTDDTGEFTLRHFKAFFFSRVKSYGAGQ